MFNLQTIFGIVLFFVLLWFLQKSSIESFVNYPPAADIVQTSGMDSLTPLPYYLKYSYPRYWYNYVSPEVYYDIPTYGPIARPWGQQSRAYRGPFYTYFY
jgi:hypothetical protein